MSINYFQMVQEMKKKYVHVFKERKQFWKKILMCKSSYVLVAYVPIVKFLQFFYRFDFCQR